MKIPNRLKVGAYTYEVKQKKTLKEKGKDVWGYCSPNTHEIYIQETMEPDKEVEVFFHETLHAIEDSYGIELGEHKVNILGIALLALIKENNLIFSKGKSHDRRNNCYVSKRRKSKREKKK